MAPKRRRSNNVVNQNAIPSQRVQFPPSRPVVETGGARETVLNMETSESRLRNHGASALSERELIALAIGGSRALKEADSLLEEFVTARSVLRAGRGELAKHTRRAEQFIAMVELVRRVDATPLNASVAYGSSRDVVAAYSPRLINRTEECVIAIVVDSRQRPIAERQLSSGGPATCAIGIREVFALSVREGGAGVVVIHNHPSGDPTPSREDVTLTTALVEAGRILEIPVLDHVIIAREGSFSFLDAGLLRAVKSDGAL